ncbi:hypothetical protein Q9L58_010748 [Maublancomyces gigas]|uniref:Uncharacterized protein n=1 Tax=Discina gigas TaxID=1032678 RepID=A0ABR3G394_9PEZI
MPRLSTLSNPTGLKDLDRKLVGIVLDDAGGRPSYSLIRLELDNVSLPANTHVILIARRGNSELRTDHGIVKNWNKNFVDLSELGTDGAWAFRILFVVPGSPKLVAVIENVRPDGLGNSESLIGMEPAELGDVPWELQILEQEGRAVILFNRDVYPSVVRAAEDVHFWTLIFPEAVRRLALFHAQAPGSLAEPEWEPFKSWLTLHGIVDEPEDGENDDDREKWCKSVVRAFCARNRVAEMLRRVVEPRGDTE